MRILHLVHQYAPDKVGGTELYTQTVAEFQAQAGHRAAIFTPTAVASPFPQPEVVNDVHLYRVPIGPRSASELFRSNWRHEELSRAWTADAFQIRRYQEGDADSLRPLAETADIILFAGFTLYHHPELRRLPAYKIIDMYDPMILENLERFADRPLAERAGLHQVGVNTFNELFQVGDFFIYATEKQWDYWLGGLTAANRVNPASYTADPTLRRLIDVVPFGLPDEPPGAQGSLAGHWAGR